MPDMQEQAQSPQERLKRVEVNPDDLDRLIDQGWDSIAQDMDATNKESLQDVTTSREWVTESDDPDLHAALTGEANSALSEINQAKDVASAEIQKVLTTSSGETLPNTEAALDKAIASTESVQTAPVEAGLALSEAQPQPAPSEVRQPSKDKAAAASPDTVVEQGEQSPEKVKLNSAMLGLVALVKEYQAAGLKPNRELRAGLKKLMFQAHPDLNAGVPGMEDLSRLVGTFSMILDGKDQMRTAKGRSYVMELKKFQAANGLPPFDLDEVSAPAPTIIEGQEEPTAADLATYQMAENAESVSGAQETVVTEQSVESGMEEREKEVGEIYQGVGEVARELRKQEGYTTDEMLAQFKDMSDKALELERTSGKTEAFKKMGKAREHLFTIIYGLSDPGERLKALDTFFQDNPELAGKAESADEGAEAAGEQTEVRLPSRPEMPEFNDFEGMMHVESWAFAVSPEQFHDFFIKKDGERHQLALKDMEDIMLTRQTLIENLSKVAPINKAVGNKIRLQIEMLQSANEITEKRRAQWQKQKELHLGEQKMAEVSDEVDKLHAERVEMEGDVRRESDLASKINEFDHKSTEFQQMILYVESLRKQVGDMDADINSQLKRLQDSKNLLAQLEGQAKAAVAQAAIAEGEAKKGVDIGMVGDWSPHEGAQKAFEGAGEAVGGAIEKTTDKFLDLTHNPTGVAGELVDKIWSIGDSKPSAKKASQPKKAA